MLKGHGIYMFIPLFKINCGFPITIQLLLPTKYKQNFMNICLHIFNFGEQILPNHHCSLINSFKLKKNCN